MELPMRLDVESKEKETVLDMVIGETQGHARQNTRGNTREQ